MFQVLLLIGIVSTIGTQNVFAMTFDVDNGGPLPDLVGGTFTITALGEQCNIGDLNVRLSIQHTFVGDLDIFLESPSNTNVQIVDQPSPGGSNDFPDVILDDSASKPIDIADGPGSPAFIVGDSYTPQNPLSAFNGEDPNGVWTLTVVDNFGADSGELFKAGHVAPVSWGVNNVLGTQLIITPEGNCDMTVSGLQIPIDTTSLLLAGAQASFVWILPIAFVAAGFAAYKLRKN